MIATTDAPPAACCPPWTSISLQRSYLPVCCPEHSAPQIKRNRRTDKSNTTSTTDERENIGNVHETIGGHRPTRIIINPAMKLQSPGVVPSATSSSPSLLEWNFDRHASFHMRMDGIFLLELDSNNSTFLQPPLRRLWSWLPHSAANSRFVFTCHRHNISHSVVHYLFSLLIARLPSNLTPSTSQVSNLPSSSIADRANRIGIVVKFWISWQPKTPSRLSYTFASRSNLDILWPEWNLEVIVCSLKEEAVLW